ncbi:MAG: ABC transporter substrate-binding protein, partial [Acetobacteraceae bacterium]|nr:ABC transporter substrate-binding protein [Acetobacteraceae bacterium]
MDSTMKTFARLALAASLLAGAAWLAPEASAQSLRIGMQAPPSTLDPHWLLNLANTGALRNMYDALVRRDAEMRIV